MAPPVFAFIITPHAALEMTRRGIDAATVRRTLVNPEQRITVRPGRDVFQSRVVIGSRHYLVRVFVDVDRTPAEVVTTYRTSKIEKYWRVIP